MIQNKRGQISLMYLFLIFAIIVLFGVFLVPIKKLDVLPEKFANLKNNIKDNLFAPIINSFDKTNIEIQGQQPKNTTFYLPGDYNQELHYG